MKKKSYILLIVAVAVIVVVGFFMAKRVEAPVDNPQSIIESGSQSVNDRQDLKDNTPGMMNNNQKTRTVDPLENSISRITKKPFGIFVTPKKSPVDPERFIGYHTAADLEIFPEEQNMDIKVLALCEGKLLLKRVAAGYGGVAVQSCKLDGKDVTVIYGHLRLSSISMSVGEQLKAGDFLGYLGYAYSSETDGERKHLHLGIHKGESINIMGYVQSASQLSNWVDPTNYLQK